MLQSAKYPGLSVEAEVSVPLATVRVMHYELSRPVDDFVSSEGAYRIDFSLSGRAKNARACFREHWHPQRFERIGDIHFVPVDERVLCRSDAVTQDSILCMLHPERLNAWFEGELVWSDDRLKACLDVAHSNIRTQLLRLGDEARHPGFASNMMVELLGAQVAIDLYRYLHGVEHQSPANGLSNWRLKLIDERLKDHSAAPTLPELATLCRLSVRQLTRGFRISRGCSLGEYVNQFRVEHAKRLLAEGASVKAVALSMGFQHASSFSYAFRRSTGETPQQYRIRQHGAR